MTTLRLARALPPVLLSLLAALGCGGGAPVPVTSEGHAIHGAVSGASKGGVTVALAGPRAASTLTDASGAFAFAGLPDGDYTLSPSEPGLAFTPASRAVRLAGADAPSQEFTETTLNNCTPQSDAAFCAAKGAACGSVTATDNCNTQRTAACGTCAGAQTCGGGGTANQCGCTPESNAAFCTVYGATCGSFTAADNCGASRAVDCGACTSGQTCTRNTCVCTPETDAQLCAAAAHACGPLTVTDRCGASRTITSCGTCAGTSPCHAGVCACSQTESDAAFCTRVHAACGAASGNDLCGNPKSVASCGTCSGFQTCGGAGTANQCGCAPETDAAFCTRQGKVCGAVTATDSCGRIRTVASCGACTAPQTCGGAGIANQCACPSESDAAFCKRLGKNCGSVSAADSCGVARTVSCGASCTAPLACGGGGTPNVCGCVAESQTQLCGAAGRTCGPLSVTDSCGVARALDCGGCASGQTCGANGLVGQCGALVAPPLAETGGHAVSVLPALLSKGIIAIHAVSETEIWVAGPDNLVRLRPEGPKPYFFPGRASSSGPARFWSSAPNDVWFARGALLARFDGAAWTAVDAGLGNNGLTALYGNAADDLFVAAGSLLRRFDGKQWTSFAVPGSGLTITDLAGNGRGTLWVASGSPATGTASVYRWNGLSYVALPGGAFGSFVQDTDRRLWVSPTGVVFTLFTGLDGCGWGGQLVVQKHDGVSWQDVATDKSSFACTVPHVANLTGTADNRVRWGAPWASAPMMYSLPSATTAFSATTTALSTEVNGVTLPRFLPGPQVACTSGAPDGKGGAWLSCGGQLARFDSGGVTLVPNPGTATVTNVFTAPSSSVWDTLSTGAIEQRKADGTVVTNGSFLGSVFVGLAGTSDSNVWAVTPDGGALHFDGAKWTSSLIPIGSSTKIVQVFAGATNAWARSSTKLYQWTAGTSGSAGSWAVVPLPGVEFPVDGVVWRDSLWVLSVDREFRFYSPSSGGGWTLQRRFSGSQPLLGASAAGPLTLSYSTAANTNDLLLEQWQTSGVVTLATIVDGTLGNGRLLLQPTAGSALFVNSDSSLQLAKF